MLYIFYIYIQMCFQYRGVLFLEIADGMCICWEFLWFPTYSFEVCRYGSLILFHFFFSWKRKENKNKSYCKILNQKKEREKERRRKRKKRWVKENFQVISVCVLLITLFS